MSEAALESLEKRALEQHARIHKSITELEAKFADVKEKLSVSRNVQQRFAVASLIVSALGFSAGYGFAGLFSRSR